MYLRVSDAEKINALLSTAPKSNDYKFFALRYIKEFYNNFENILGTNYDSYDNFGNYELNEKNKHYDSLAQYHNIIKHNNI